MKAKSVFQFLLAGVAFALAVFLPNELVAMVHGASAFLPNELASFVQDSSAQDLLHSAPMLGMATVSFANLDATSYQKPNPGGLRLLLIVNAKDVTGVWPKAADIVAGEIATAPTMVSLAKIATYSVPDDTFSLTDSQEGDPGFQSYKQTAAFMLAGFSSAMITELTKHLNAGSLIIGELNDGTYALVGTTDKPMYLKTAFNSGAKGADKRGYTCKAEQEGLMWGVTPIKTTIVTALSLLP